MAFGGAGERVIRGPSQPAGEHSDEGVLPTRPLEAVTVRGDESASGDSIVASGRGGGRPPPILPGCGSAERAGGTDSGAAQVTREVEDVGQHVDL